MSTNQGEPPAGGRGRSRLWRYLIGALVLLLIGEALSYAALSFAPNRVRRLLYEPPQPSREEVETYLAQRDPVLGWPLDDGSVPGAGPRPSPASAELVDQAPCVSLYGETITFGYDVSDQDAWGNLLASSLGCPVENFGVNGYSVTQSVLRFGQNEADSAPLTILGIDAESASRTISQWHYFLNPNPTLYAGIFGFRPTLSANDPATVVPPPIHSYDEFVEMAEHPERLLTNEGFLPGSPNRNAPLVAAFPYTLSLLQLVWKIAAIDRSVDFFSTPVSDWNLPYWFETQDGLPPEALDRLGASLHRFAETCADRGKTCAVLLLPDPDTVRYRNSAGRDLTAPLVATVPAGTTFWDSIDAFAAGSRDVGYCHFVGSARDCEGYLNPDGHRLLKNFVLERAREIGPPAATTSN